mmetsp:Transcript_20006/g.34431  ORF Transcript_20006/g.34431 Transcript_20006/m.34431 type:complete len:82 (+) Transcript_20006:452-697(+)
MKEVPSSTVVATLKQTRRGWNSVVNLSIILMRALGEYIGCISLHAIEGKCEEAKGFSWMRIKIHLSNVVFAIWYSGRETVK